MKVIKGEATSLAIMGASEVLMSFSIVVWKNDRFCPASSSAVR
ncbi:MAG TPA: hypothetical protein PK975_04980 [Candidatus Hydrogenedentes bacterium]|nr:hypothetical protein [Candidatus Hydrogenedentota bacterium]HPO86335.1 hypothetical protein [Candidatus Hydrogenedentota bacterium]